MSVPIFTWTRSAEYVGNFRDTTTTAPPPGLAAIKEAVDDNAANNPDSKWQVASYDAVAAYLVLKPKNGGDRRVMLFGGAAPAVAARPGVTLADTYLIHIGLSRTGDGGQDIPPVNYTVGKPYNDWCYGNIIGARTSINSELNRLRIFEFEDGIAFHFYASADNPATFCWAGPLIVTENDQILDTCGGAGIKSLAGLGNNRLNAVWGLNGFLYSSITTNYNVQRYVDVAGIDVQYLLGLSVLNSQDGSSLLGEDGTRKFVPILVTNQTKSFLLGRMRQIYIGPNITNGTLNSAPSTGFAVSRDSTPDGTIWLLNQGVE